MRPIWTISEDPVIRKLLRLIGVLGLGLVAGCGGGGGDNPAATKTPLLQHQRSRSVPPLRRPVASAPRMQGTDSLSRRPGDRSLSTELDGCVGLIVANWIEPVIVRLDLGYTASRFDLSGDGDSNGLHLPSTASQRQLQLRERRC